MKKKNHGRDNDELDMSHLNETVEETERRRDAEANLTALQNRGPAAPNFDAPFAPGLGSAGIIPNDEDGDYTESGTEMRSDLGDGSQEGLSDLNDISGNPQVYSGGKTADDLADLSEGGMGGMSIEHVNDVNHGTRGLPEEMKAHEKKRTAERVRFKTGTNVKANSASTKKSTAAKPATKAISGNKPVAKKAVAKKTTPKKSPVKKTVTKKVAAKKSPAKKSSAKKSVNNSRKVAAKKKTSAKKSPAKKSTAKKAAKSSSKKSGNSRRKAVVKKKVSAKKKSSSKKSSKKNTGKRSR